LTPSTPSLGTRHSRLLLDHCGSSIRDDLKSGVKSTTRGDLKTRAHPNGATSNDGGGVMADGSTNGLLGDGLLGNGLVDGLVGDGLVGDGLVGDGLVGDGRSVREAGAWAYPTDGDCLVVSFSAREFVPQQVRGARGGLGEG